jgi:hypothetical protein
MNPRICAYAYLTLAMIGERPESRQAGSPFSDGVHSVPLRRSRHQRERYPVITVQYKSALARYLHVFLPFD